MESIYSLNGQEILDTPLLLFECALNSGLIERWSTHSVIWNGEEYRPVLLRHNSFELRAAAEDGIDGVPRISVTLANADGHFAEVERITGWKGAKLTVRFLFYDLANHTATSEARVVFKGVADAPEEITEATLRLSFSNRLSLRRSELPQLRIQRQCPWIFPKSDTQRAEAADGGTQGKYSAFYACGYCADQPGGVGTLNESGAYTACGYTRSDCVARGMFDRDSRGNVTRRFAGIEFVPQSVLVRTHGDKGFHSAAVLDNEAKYNDVVPLVYGTAWVQPPLILARNDGNLTHCEVLVSASQINRVLKVVVNNIEIPEATNTDMSATGWFKIVSSGQRTGTFNPDFTDEQGNPTGDPYGGLSVLSVVVPNRVSDGATRPRIQVLVEGMKIPQYDDAGTAGVEAFSSNPAWVLLDILRRTGWTTEEMDIASFARCAAFCDERLDTSDAVGRAVTVPRFRCNYVVRRRTSAAELVRGIRRGAGLLLRFADDGRLEAVLESTIAAQQPSKPPCSNSTEPLNEGWPAYEFGDGSNGYGGILRRSDGASTIRVWSRSAADTPNRFTLDFQDEFNVYQQDSLSVVDADDVLRSGQETTAALTAAGVPNFNQAARVIKTQLQRSVCGNTYVDFDTGLRGFGIRPGDIITLTYLSHGFNRQPFRVLRIAPGSNYRTSSITAQIHDDAWYRDDAAVGGGTGQEPGGGVGIPRPISGVEVDEHSDTAFGISEEGHANADGSYGIRLRVKFRAPEPPARTLSVPLLSLSAIIDFDGGSLQSAHTYYYGIAAVDGSGLEGPLSFLVRAEVPDGPDSAQVTLNDIRCPGAATGFRVYRGTDPVRLARIGAGPTNSTTYVDKGDPATDGVPTDAYYDHTNFYWREEFVPQVRATSVQPNSIETDGIEMIANEYSGCIVRILSGPAKGEERIITSNTPTGVSVEPAWSVIPSAGDEFCITEPGWRPAAVVAGPPAVVDIPNREGMFVQICGRAANVGNREAAYEFSPVTRWRIGGSAPDSDVPSEPMFALNSAGRGSFEIGGIGFRSLDDTRTVTAGVLSAHYFDEIEGDRSCRLTVDIDESQSVVSLSGDTFAAGGTLQIGREVLRILGIGEGGSSYEVERGAYGSPAEAHKTGDTVFALKRRIYTLSFPKDFFGTPASGSYTHEFPLRNARIALAEMSVMNCKGNSQAYAANVTAIEDCGVRTMSGGQFSLQVDGYLAIQTNAVPTVLIDDCYAVRDIRASLGLASTQDVRLRVNRNGQEYATLTVPAGQIVSTPLDGFALGPLRTGDSLTLDVVSVGQDAGGNPGRDLTVTIRV